MANLNRNKLLNATLFFAKNTKGLNTTKLLKLLYFLDFSYFKQTGYPSIGLEYYSFQNGPVPKSFWLEIKGDKVPEDFEGKIAIIPVQDENSFKTGYKERQFKALVPPDMSVFSPREKELLTNLASIFRDAKAWLMSEATHLHSQPWDTTIKTKGKNKPIDYLLCLDEEDDICPAVAQESLKEYFEMLDNFDIHPSK